MGPAYYQNTGYWRDPCSIGWLIYVLQVDEGLAAKEEAADASEGVLYGSPDALERVQRFRDRQIIDSCIVHFAGIDRIRLLCYKLDTDLRLTSANVTRLLIKICDAKNCLPEEAKKLSLDYAADVLVATEGTKSFPGQKGMRGRKADPDIDPKMDERLYKDWKAAKAQGMTRKAFADERGKQVDDIIAVVDRMRYRRRRDKK